MAFRITKAFEFDAAHWLPHVPAGHRCGRLHGHTYRVVVTLEGALQPELGWVEDFGAVKSCFAPLREQLDHSCLNEIAGLENPTAEVLAAWLYERLSRDLPQLTEVTVQETPTSTASYRP
jgi:6-pyruvoyltetrahydropterin/6-carboxytetrahydropterin synthase